MTRLLSLSTFVTSFAIVAMVAGKAKKAKVAAEMSWMKGTTWHWNEWNDVTFEADGTFSAPTPDCEAGKCRWGASKSGEVKIKWGKSGLHKVRIAKDRKSLKGKRVKDGQPCAATFVSGGEFSMWSLVPKMPKLPKALVNLPETSLGMVGAAAARIGEPWVPGFFMKLGTAFALVAVTAFGLLVKLK